MAGQLLQNSLCKRNKNFPIGFSITSCATWCKNTETKSGKLLTRIVFSKNENYVWLVSYPKGYKQQKTQNYKLLATKSQFSTFFLPIRISYQSQLANSTWCGLQRPRRPILQGYVRPGEGNSKLNGPLWKMPHLFQLKSWEPVCAGWSHLPRGKRQLLWLPDYLSQWRL